MPVASSDLLRFYIDLNSVRGNQVGTLLRRATDPLGAQISPPMIGDSVSVYDEDGNVCGAVVTERHGEWVGLELDWSSWTPSVTVDAPTVYQARPAARPQYDGCGTKTMALVGLQSADC